MEGIGSVRGFQAFGEPRLCFSSICPFYFKSFSTTSLQSAALICKGHGHSASQQHSCSTYSWTSRHLILHNDNKFDHKAPAASFSHNSCIFEAPVLSWKLCRFFGVPAVRGHFTPAIEPALKNKYGSRAVKSILAEPEKLCCRSDVDDDKYFRHRRILLVSTPVGPLGSGLGGGVELTLGNIAREMIARGIEVEIVAPMGSVLPGVPNIVQIPGELQELAQNQTREDPITLSPDSVLANMWEYVRFRQQEVDVVVNFAFDWLPLYVTAFLNVPVGHLISMGSLNIAMDLAIKRVINAAPGSVACHTFAQARTFPTADKMIPLGNGFDLSRYQFSDAGKDGPLVWVGRIAPEKGLEDAVAAADKAGISLRVLGHMQEPEYWDQVISSFPGAKVEYAGFLPTEEMAKLLGESRAMLTTPKWIEAFGNVVVEALACGCPVIAYKRGGPAEIVEDGVSGFLVEADDVDALVDRIQRLPEIDRARCRNRAAAEYSQQAMVSRVLGWLRGIMDHGDQTVGAASDSIAVRARSGVLPSYI